MDGWVTATPASLAFAPTPIGGTSAPQLVHVTNPSPVNVHACNGGCQMIHPGRQTESLMSCKRRVPADCRLATGASCDLSVVFTPTTWGSKNAQLYVESYESFKTTIVTIPLSGTGTDTTPPVLTPSIAGTLGDNSWYTSPATVTWTTSDPNRASPQPADATHNADERYGRDDADLLGDQRTGPENSKAVTVKIDKTAPTATCSAAPAPCGRRTTRWFPSRRP